MPALGGWNWDNSISVEGFRKGPDTDDDAYFNEIGPGYFRALGIPLVAGRTLRDLILGRDTELTRLPWVGPLGRQWEPEPLRWLGIRYLQSAFLRLDRRAERSGRPPTGRSLAEQLGRH